MLGRYFLNIVVVDRAAVVLKLCSMGKQTLDCPPGDSKWPPFMLSDSALSASSNACCAVLNTKYNGVQIQISPKISMNKTESAINTSVLRFVLHGNRFLITRIEVTLIRINSGNEKMYFYS